MFLLPGNFTKAKFFTRIELQGARYDRLLTYLSSKCTTYICRNVRVAFLFAQLNHPIQQMVRWNLSSLVFLRSLAMVGSHWELQKSKFERYQMRRKSCAANNQSKISLSVFLRRVSTSIRPNFPLAVKHLWIKMTHSVSLLSMTHTSRLVSGAVQKVGRWLALFTDWLKRAPALNLMRREQERTSLGLVLRSSQQRTRSSRHYRHLAVGLFATVACFEPRSSPCFGNLPCIQIVTASRQRHDGRWAQVNYLKLLQKSLKTSSRQQDNSAQLSQCAWLKLCP